MQDVDATVQFNKVDRKKEEAVGQGYIARSRGPRKENVSFVIFTFEPL